MPKFCPNCGAPLTEGAKFCGSCGTPIANETVPAAPVADEPAREQAVTPQNEWERAKAAKAATNQCPNCGGVLVFDAASGHLTCNHCGHVFEEGEGGKTIPIGEVTLQKGETTHARSVEDFLERAPWEVSADGSANAVRYSCPSCAAEIVADQSTVATSCPYCGNNMLVSGIANSSNIPRYVLPFSVTKDQAKERMRAHFEHKWYLSRAFSASLEHMQGVYVPYHLYDINVSGSADYIGYRDESDEDSSTRYYYAIKRAGHASFNQIPIDSSSKMPDSHMDAIAPFSFSDLKDFDANYAAGFLMEVADEDVDECRPRAEELARSSFENDLKADARQESRIEGIEEVVRQDTRIDVVSSESCVLPVWLMHCTWEDVQMLFAVNGETGKCVGDLPIDSKRRIATVMATLFATIVLAVLAYIFVIKGNTDTWKFAIGAVVFVALVTFMVDSHFTSQMHTAVVASDADMSYDDEGLVVTERWRSHKSYLRKSKARDQL